MASYYFSFPIPSFGHDTKSLPFTTLLAHEVFLQLPSISSRRSKCTNQPTTLFLILASLDLIIQVFTWPGPRL